MLPFTNMSGEPEQEYFSDGISEDLITALSKLRWFLVIARNSSFIYKGKSVHLRQVAEELGVRYVVEGSVRKSGDRVRITAQLNDVVSGSHIWAEKYDRALTDVFAVQDEITERIVFSIQPQLYGAESFRAQRKPPENLDAWDLVMRALSHYWRVTRAITWWPRPFWRRRSRSTPNTGKRLALLASSYMFTAHMGWIDLRSAMATPSAPLSAAIRLDAEDAWAHVALGHVHLFARRFDDLLAEFETALRLNPNFALALGYYGLSLSYSGRWQEADEVVGRALRLSPRDPLFGGVCGHSGLREISRRRLPGCDPAIARRDTPAQRFCRSPPGTCGLRGHGGRRRSRRRRSGGVPPRAAEHLARLDPDGNADQVGSRTGPVISKGSVAPG